MNGKTSPEGTGSSSGPGHKSEDMEAGGGGWPVIASPVFKFGLIVGFALLLVGGLPMMLVPVSWTLETFIICTGLSIILGAFGSTARVKFVGDSGMLLGVAAIALVIFMVLIDQMSDRYVHIRLTGDVRLEQVKAVELNGDIQYPGGFSSSQKTWDFFVFGKEIKNPTLALRMILVGEDDEERFFECIASKQLTPFLASGKTIHWKYSENGNKLVNVGNGKEVGAIGCSVVEGGFVDANPSTRSPAALGFVASAYAAEPSDSESSTNELIKSLDSDSSYLRRDAREQLGQSGEDAVRPLLQTLSKENATYKMQLGSLVALSKISRSKNVDVKIIKNGLQQSDIDRLVAVATHKDKTMRVYASEFLYRLGDPRVIEPALEKIATSSSDGKYNLLLVISASLSDASDDQKKLASRRVPELKADGAPRTNSLIDKIMMEANAP